MLKSAVIEDKKFKHNPSAVADNSLRPIFLCQQEGRITMVICCKFRGWSIFISWGGGGLGNFSGTPNGGLKISFMNPYGGGSQI